MEKEEQQTRVSSSKSSLKLANPVHTKWPVLSSDDEAIILEKLGSICGRYKDCLRVVKKTKPKWKKTEKPDEPLTEEEVTQRKKIKSWIVMGINHVIRSLEADRLRLVLICKETEPAVLKTAVLQLVQRQNCPAASVGNMLATFKQSWTSLSSLTAFGVLKSEEENDFDELVKCVKTHAPNIGLATLSTTEKGASNGTTDEPGNKGNNSHTTDNSGDSNTAKSTEKSVTTEPGLASVSKSNLPSTSRTSERVGLITSEASPTKYYIYKSTKDEEKFEGQSFIGFSSDHVVSDTVHIVSGVSRHTDDDTEKVKSFGIMPVTSTSKSDSLTCSETDISKGVKRKLTHDKVGINMDKSSYRSINVKQLVKNPNVKKRKKKNKNKKVKH